MTAKRAYMLLVGAVAAVILLCVLGIVGGNNLLEKQTTKIVNLKLESGSLNAESTAVAQAQRDIAKYDELNKIARTIVPQDKDQALTVRELVDLAGRSGISIGSVTFPVSNLGGKTSTSKLPSQVTAVKGIKGLYQMPITLESDSKKAISFTQLISFLNALENNRHTAQVSQLTINPAESGAGKLTFRVTVSVFIKP
jgi:hypothetical protein